MRRGFALFAWSLIAAGIVGFLYLAPSDGDRSHAPSTNPSPASPIPAISQPASTLARFPVAPAANSPAPASAPLVSASGAQPNLEPGMLPLEQAANVGRASPAATMQTMIWAVLRKEDAELAACVLLEPAAREKALAYLERLPPSARAPYETPEQLAALFLAGATLHLSAYQVVATRPVEGDEAIVTFRRQIGPEGKPVNVEVRLRLGSNGWALPVSGSEMEGLLRAISSGNIAPR